MSEGFPFINNFNGGELSPKLAARSDIGKYFSGCRTLENFIPLVEGGAIRLPGTYFVAEVKHSDKATRVVEFHFSTVQAYVLEFGEKYIRFYKDLGQIVNSYAAWVGGGTAYELGDLVTEGGSHYRCIVAHNSGAVFAVDLAAGKWEATDGADDLAYEIPTTYLETEVFQLKFAQSADTLYIVHQEHAPAKLTRTGHTDWTLEDIAFVANPFGANDYPGAVAFFEQRLCLGGSEDNPQRIWGSVSGDYEDMTVGAGDDAAFTYDISSGRVDSILWALGQEQLMLGTVGGVWKVGATTYGDPVTPTNVKARKQIWVGAKNLAPEPATGTALWVSRGGTSVRQLIYDYVSDTWTGPDVTRVNKDIAKGSSASGTGIVDTAFQVEPVPISWAVRADGTLLGMTYETQEEVYAWFRGTTIGEYKSVAVIGAEDSEDEVWVVVEREVDGATVKYVEYFKPHEFYSEIVDCFFVHSGLTFNGGDAENVEGISNADPAVVTITGHSFVNGDEVRIKDCVGMTEVNVGLKKAYTVANAGANTFELSGIDSTGWGTWTSGGTAQKVTSTPSGAGHLEGEEVVVLIDGAAYSPNPTVASGTVSLSIYGNKIHLGLGFDSTLEPSKLVAQDSKGTTKGRKQRVTGLHLVFYETIGGKAGEDMSSLKFIPFGVGGTPTLFTGTKSFVVDGDWGEEAAISVVQDQPLPMTVLALIPQWEVSEN